MLRRLDEYMLVIYILDDEIVIMLVVYPTDDGFDGSK
jgi:hypothetical protein